MKDLALRALAAEGGDAQDEGDLIVCRSGGFAAQADGMVTAKYDEAYFEKYQGYEGSEIALLINCGRVAMVARHVGDNELVCDVGVGSGEFIRSRPWRTFGIDVNPAAERWLKDNRLWAYDLKQFRAFTFWDAIEHVPEPRTYLDCIPVGGWAFFSVPIFDDLAKVRSSRHYRPGEHLYYWTRQGFRKWLELYGFELREMSDFESTAGRDSIGSFAFQRMNSGRL